MSQAFIDLSLFTAKGIIIVIFILLVMLIFFALLGRGKHKTKGRLLVKNLNKKYAEMSEAILTETLDKKALKRFYKGQKAEEKAKLKSNITPKRIYILNFHGDVRATEVETLREEVTAILNIAAPGDEVLVRLESAGGMVHTYGLAAAQLIRFRNHHIPLTICIDKIAASGGYLMASVADKILAAPFAIIGSIGVIVQLPNFHKLLKEKNIDFEQHTAGEFKRTITMFGQNTAEGRKKLQEEIEDIHQLFKNQIVEYRHQIDIDKVATGEHWLGKQAINLQLVDELKTSDEFLLEHSKTAQLFEIIYEMKKPFLSKFMASKGELRNYLFHVE